MNKLNVLKSIAIIVCVLRGSGGLYAEEASNQSNPKIPEPIADKGYHLVKNWDFSKNVLNLDDLHKEFYTRYASNNGTLDHLGPEWERYSDHNNHVISDGVLHLVARDPTGVLKSGAIESGLIRSKWETKYGYFEAKMKVPKGKGMWPAFWFSAVYWPPEIDVMEIVNNQYDDTHHSFHSLHGKFIGQTNSTLLNKWNVYSPGFDYADDFHVFAVEWTPTGVKHYVDNILVVDRNFDWRHDNGQIGDPTPIVVNLAVGGDWPGPPSDLSEFPASLDVAYIRAWQK